MIDHFRARWFGEDERALGRSADALMNSPGRAQGRVADWSLCRMAAVLQRGARRPLDIAPVGTAQLTANERSLLAILDALSEGDDALAARHAEWLVAPSSLRAFLSATAPLADIYPKLSRAA